MAIFHCNISNVSRAKGSSSCATLSYITGQKIYEERTDKTYNYGRKERVVFHELISPFEFGNEEELFNSIENFEKANNARTAKKIEVALPRELTLESQLMIVKNYVQKNIVDKGYPCVFAIHEDEKGNNPHAHILVANRQISDDGKWQQKIKKEYVLDQDGERVPIIDKKTGKQKVDKRNRKQWKRINVEQNLLDKKEFLKELREQWANECNLFLEENKKIDHRSYADQGIEIVPTIHEGYASRQMAAKNKISDRIEINNQIRENNKLIENIINRLLELKKEKGEEKHEKEGKIAQKSKMGIEDGLKEESLLQKAPKTSYKSRGWER